MGINAHVELGDLVMIVVDRTLLKPTLPDYYMPSTLSHASPINSQICCLIGELFIVLKKERIGSSLMGHAFFVTDGFKTGWLLNYEFMPIY